MLNKHVINVKSHFKRMLLKDVINKQSKNNNQKDKTKHQLSIADIRITETTTRKKGKRQNRRAQVPTWLLGSRPA